MPQVEVLSPAGSMESFRAAINAGADAVYVGGSMYGARAYANNFDTEQLKEALDIAHIHGRKVYLTVNTLLKNSEIENSLYEFLRPAYENGLDAVLIQDFGVFEFIRKNFPGMDLHASTQMTINGVYSAKLLQKKGFSRIVTSRELSLEEIREIRRETSLEIESFVHGALCYCYSGQCLLSGMIGGRSGNRGRCAQPCRLLYEAFDADGSPLAREKRHLLSPKDICVLELLPDIIDAGVCSLKIEGRMKSPQYTAGVVSIYRKYVDRYLAWGRHSYQVEKQDVNRLMDLFNRGNFSKGYYQMQNGPEMMSMNRPNHQGTKALEVLSSSRGKMTVKALEDLYPQDVVEVSEDFTWTNGCARKQGESFCINIPGNLRVKNGAVFYRVRNNTLLKEINEHYLAENIREDVLIRAKFSLGEKAWASISCGEYSFETEGNVVMKAQNSPVSAEQIKKQLSKLGNTEFCAETTDVLADENIFIPVQELKELRRKLAEGLASEMILRRDASQTESVPFSCWKSDGSGKKEKMTTPIPGISVTVYEKKQLAAVLNVSEVRRVYFEMSRDGFAVLQEVSERIKSSGKEAFLVLPHIFRKNTVNHFLRNLMMLKNAGFDGFLIKNLDELGFLEENDVAGRRILDYPLYQFNDCAKSFFEGKQIEEYTISPELNQNEILGMDNRQSEMIVFGRIPVMVSAQCVMKNLCGCCKGTRKESLVLYLKDRTGKKMPVVNQCAWCYNIIYNPSTLNLLENAEQVKKCGVKDIRLDFQFMNEAEIHRILSETVQCFVQDKKIEAKGDFTRGHFLRGVE